MRVVDGLQVVLGDDAEVVSAALEGFVKVSVCGVVGVDDAAAGEDDFVVLDAVAGESDAGGVEGVPPCWNQL